MVSRTPAPAGMWIREARLRGGLSQQELARRVGTSQSLVARWERGQVDPRFSTVVRAIRACGFDLALGVVTYDYDHDLLVRENLRLAPKERLRKMQEIRRGLNELTARAKPHGES